MLILSDLIGTSRTGFVIAKATLDASGLTASRSIVFQDKAGTVALTSDIWTVIRKTADENKSANTTLANDSALVFAMAANTKYAFNAKIWFDTTANADFKWRHSGPASPTLVRLERKWAIPGGVSNNAAIDTAFAAADLTIVGTGTIGGTIDIIGIVHNGSNAGTFAIQWAQNTSDAGNTIVRAGSWLDWTTI